MGQRCHCCQADLTELKREALKNVKVHKKAVTKNCNFAQISKESVAILHEIPNAETDAE